MAPRVGGGNRSRDVTGDSCGSPIEGHSRMEELATFCGAQESSGRSARLRLLRRARRSKEDLKERRLRFRWDGRMDSNRIGVRDRKHRGRVRISDERI